MPNEKFNPIKGFSKINNKEEKGGSELALAARKAKELYQAYREAARTESEGEQSEKTQQAKAEWMSATKHVEALSRAARDDGVEYYSQHGEVLDMEEGKNLRKQKEEREYEEEYSRIINIDETEARQKELENLYKKMTIDRDEKGFLKVTGENKILKKVVEELKPRKNKEDLVADLKNEEVIELTDVVEGGEGITGKTAEEILKEMGLDVKIEKELECAIEEEAVKLKHENNESIAKIFDQLELSEEERTEVITNIEITLNGALDAEAEREFSRLWKYHKKVLAAGLGVGALAGACSAGARMLGVKAASGIVGGIALGFGAGALRGKIREWMNPAIEKIKKKNAKKLEKIRKEKGKELFNTENNNVKNIAVQEIRRAAISKFLEGKEKNWMNVSALKNNALTYINSQENFKDLSKNEKEKLANGIAVLAEVMNENSRRLNKIIEGKTGGKRMSEVKRSALLGGVIGGAVSVSQSIADSPYAPAIAGGAIGGIMMGRALDVAWAKREIKKKSEKLIKEIDSIEDRKEKIIPEEISRIKSYLESGFLDKYPVVREKAKKIIMDDTLQGIREFNRGEIEKENKILAKNFKHSKAKKIASYVGGIAVGMGAGYGMSRIVEHVREAMSAGQPRDGWEKMWGDMKAERDKYGLGATDEQLEQIAKYHPMPGKAMSIIHKKGPADLMNLLEEAKIKMGTAAVAGEETFQKPETGKAPKVTGKIPMTEEEVMAAARKMDSAISEDMDRHKVDTNIDAMGEEKNNLDKIIDQEAVEVKQGEPSRLPPKPYISENEAETILKPEIKLTKPIDIKIEGKTDTFSEGIYEAVKQADQKIQENFIRRVNEMSGKEVIIDSLETRAKLLKQAIQQLSAANIKIGDNLDMQNLVYEGNVVRLNSDGSFEVLKGEGIKEAQIVSELNLRQNASKEWAHDLGLDPEKIKYAGDVNNLDSREMITEVEGHEVLIGRDGVYEADIVGEKITGTVEAGEGAKAIADQIKETEQLIGEKGKEAAMLEMTSKAVDDYAQHGISEETMKELNINPYDGISVEEKRILDHLVNHNGNLDQAVDSIKLAREAGISYEDAMEYYHQLNGVSGNSQRMEGVLMLVKNNYQGGLGKIFGVEVSDNNYEFAKGVHRIKNVAEGFDMVARVDGGEIKFGVDGPWGKWNWGEGGRSYRCRIDADLTNSNIEDAKAQIIEMAKSMTRTNMAEGR